MATPAQVRVVLRRLSREPRRRLDQSEEQLLLWAVRHDVERDQCRTVLVERNVALCWSVAWQYVRPEHHADAVAVGMVGLLQAVDDFDQSYGCRLSTVALHRIRQRIQRFASQQQDMIRVPEYMVTLRNQVRRTVATLGRTDDGPTVLDVAELLHQPVGMVELARHVEGLRTTSIDSLSPLVVPVVSDHAPAIVERATLVAAVERLPVQLRNVLVAFYGFDDEPRTVQRIARDEGIDVALVVERLDDALERLRGFLDQKQ
jgi:RNA polymerase sigma factor (sigma-70 family)